eukprot:4822249-Prymnesium_polylepis.1
MHASTAARRSPGCGVSIVRLLHAPATTVQHRWHLCAPALTAVSAWVPEETMPSSYSPPRKRLAFVNRWESTTFALCGTRRQTWRR